MWSSLILVAGGGDAVLAVLGRLLAVGETVPESDNKE